MISCPVGATGIVITEIKDLDKKLFSKFVKASVIQE